MDGIRNIAGERTSTLKIGDKTYTLTPQILAEYGERESYILSLKPNPLTVLAALPPLPPTPEAPVPPEVKEGAEAAAAYVPKLRAYKQAKARHDQLVTARARLEDRAWREATRPAVVTMEEDSLFDNSVHGLGWRLYRGLRAHHPEIDSVQAALDLIEQIGDLRAVRTAVQQAEEKDLLGNSDGPADGPAKAGESLGQPSIDPSQTATDGVGTSSIA